MWHAQHRLWGAESIPELHATPLYMWVCDILDLWLLTIFCGMATTRVHYCTITLLHRYTNTLLIIISYNSWLSTAAFTSARLKEQQATIVLCVETIMAWTYRGQSTIMLPPCSLGLTMRYEVAAKDLTSCQPLRVRMCV